MWVCIKLHHSVLKYVVAKLVSTNRCHAYIRTLSSTSQAPKHTLPEQHRAMRPVQTRGLSRVSIHTIVIVIIGKAGSHLEQVGDQGESLCQGKIKVLIARPWNHRFVACYEHACRVPS